MTVSAQVATAHGHERESIKDGHMKCDERYCKKCGAWFIEVEKENPDVARTA